MAKTNQTADKKKVLYIFGAIVTIFMLYSSLSAVFSKDSWIRQAEFRWADIRIHMPTYLGYFNSEGDLSDFFGKYYNHPADQRISIAAIDEYTVQEMGYPFKRRHYATLIEKLNQLGVKAIGIDILLADSDRDDKASDQRMVAAVKKAGNVSVLVYVDPQTGNLKYPVQGLGEAAKIISHPHVENEIQANGQVRSVALFSPAKTYNDVKIKTVCGKNCDGVGLPLLAMGTFALYDGTPLRHLEMRYGGEAKKINFRTPQIRQIHPGWRKKDDVTLDSVYRHISVKDIIDGRLAPEEKAALKGGIVLVGATAMGAYDHYPSPFYATWPGVELHANAIDNLLHNDFLKPVPGWPVILLMIFVIWLPIMLAKKAIKIISLVSVSVILSLMVFNIYLITRLYDMPYLSLFVAMLIPFIFVTVYKAFVEGREKRWIKNTFGQYLSPKVVDIITKDPSKLVLGGEKREMTVFFLDIAGFTTMSEKLTPEQLTAMLNKYLSGLTDVIMKYDGVVDKFIGDCIMAFWNAPLDQAEHRKLACQAAVDCNVELDRLNAELTDTDIKPSFRIGLNSGPMVVGNMGSNTRFSYTVLGDAVNLASRLEGANKFFHSKIMVSEATYEGAKDAVEARLLGSVRVVGKAIPVKVYELMGHKGNLEPMAQKVLENYNKAFALFYKNSFAEAAKGFKTVLAIDAKDGPSAFYLALAEKYAVSVPKDWDGTFNLTSK